ncbi:MAG: hypothetical protein WCT49_05300 [Candidatus Paceibacterota bacterium]|jgi:hypothetical protein|nr:hypothetical protein [Candidatus Paceibacterota bacterium]
METSENIGLEMIQEVVISKEEATTLQKTGSVKVFEKPSNVELGENVMVVGEGYPEPIVGCYKQIGPDIMLIVG